MENRQYTSPDRNESVPALLIFAGGAVLLSQIFSFGLWPLLVLIPGLIILFGSCAIEDEAAAWMAIPGSLIAGTGVILMVQEALDIWYTWWYVWTLYGVFLGMAFIFVSNRIGEDESGNIGEVGRGMVRYSFLAFAGLGIFTELLVGGEQRQMIISIGLVLAGLYLLQRENDDEQDSTFVMNNQWNNPNQSEIASRQAMPQMRILSSEDSDDNNSMVYGLGAVDERAEL